MQFAPLFGHQYSHVWIDFRGIQDAYMRGARHRLLRELAPRDALAARLRDRQSGRAGAATARDVWGLSRVRRPARRDARRRRAARATFHTYAARGAGVQRVNDDGTIAPTAAGGSIAFAPEIVVPALVAMRARVRRAAVRTVRLPRRVQPDACARRAAVHHGTVVHGAGLVRHRLPRHRPGSDPRHDRELSHRTDLERFMRRRSGHRARPVSRGLHRRLARGAMLIRRAPRVVRRAMWLGSAAVAVAVRGAVAMPTRARKAAS